MSSDPVTADLTRNTEGTPRERLTRMFFFLCAFVSVLTTVGVVLALVVDAAKFFRLTGTLLGIPAEQTVPVVDFLTGTRWSPALRGGTGEYGFGVLELVSGTLIITVGSALIALPLGLATAVYLSEYANPRLRAYLKPALEVLAGVPTVVYGFFALVYITPALDVVLPVDLSTFNALSASIVVGIMIIPMVSSISEDAMSAVPDDLRQAAYGMGATKFDVSTGVVVPAAASGIASSFILAISRAIGETMAVTIAAGMTPRLPPGGGVDVGGVTIPYPTAETPGVYAEPIQTMTSAMVELATSDITGSGAAYNSLFAIGLTLFVITLAMNIVSDVIAERYREEY
jgi:phosphate transport system permease protein